MKKLLLSLLFLVFGGSLNAVASHYIGAEIFYQQISQNSYQVYLRNYRDCAGTAGSTSTVVQVKAPGCNTGRYVPLTLLSRKTSNPYGPGVTVNCQMPSSYSLYEILTFSGVVTFSPAEMACPDWVLSWSECCRSEMGNIVNGSGSSLYTEANLKLLPGLLNSSPAFDTINAPLIYANYQKDYVLSMAASDPNGDSLAYRLVAPLESYNYPLTYKPLPSVSTYTSSFFGQPALVFNPNPQLPYANPFNPQVAQLAGGMPTNYSPQFPMVSVMVNWNGAPTVPMPGAPGGMIWAANYLFDLDPVNGKLKFNATFFDGNTQPGPGKNQYLVSILVDEYRKVNGVYTKIGSVRRESMIKVFSATQNLNPVIQTPIANNQPLASGTEIRLRPGTPLTLQFSASDEDATDVVSVSTNATYLLPGATFTATSGNVATGTITWTPTAAHVREQPYYFQIMLRDNANPLRGVQTETIAVRVSATGSVTGTDEAMSHAGFTAYPNPFSEELTFSLNLQTKAESIQIYNLLGQKIEEISLKTVGLGAQKVQWQHAGKHAAGTYLARLIAQDKTVQTLKFTKIQ